MVAESASERDSEMNSIQDEYSPTILTIQLDHSVRLFKRADCFDYADCGSPNGGQREASLAVCSRGCPGRLRGTRKDSLQENF